MVIGERRVYMEFSFLHFLLSRDFLQDAGILFPCFLWDNCFLDGAHYHVLYQKVTPLELASLLQSS